MEKETLIEKFFEWLTDIKTLLAVLFITILIFWQFGGKPERLLNMADNVLTAVFSLAVGYKLGKAANGNPPPKL